ncbi:hypothetical protein EVAR_61278_1 [Eumeta japonica]|uniref:Uncharacterized protein n=1 Tax=Eumeta variegata TaxID=151549 RepID=A0A4C1Z5H6_EUMVA|nr:hypothetical protein EVAR_61278_1 [Eumeta japonica]
MKVNVGYTKVMVFERGESITECDVLIEGEKVEEVQEFVYLTTNNGEYDRDIKKENKCGNKENGTLFAIMNNKASHNKHAWLEKGMSSGLAIWKR